MTKREGGIRIVLEPISRGRQPVTLDITTMQSIFLREGGAVFLNPTRGWRAHFHDDEAMLKDATVDAVPAERLARVATRSRRTEDGAAHVEAWLLSEGSHVLVQPTHEGDVFMYKRRKFPRMRIEVIQ